jgi:alanyl-tRNA synthetase
VDEEDRIAHVLAGPLDATEVAGAVDWTRRYDHMQQHTGQHLLSAVLEELFGIATVSFHLGAEVSTIDVSGALTEEKMEEVEGRCAAIAAEARPVAISFEEEAGGLRKASAREGTLRIVAIGGIDRSACGGTHVRTTAEIGLVLLGKTDRVRNTTRLEFVCGNRALGRARGDFRSLAAIARVLSAPAGESATLISALIEKNKAIEKDRHRLAGELARHQGQALYEATPVAADGLRRVTETGPIDDAMRTRAQAFTANPKAVFVGVCEQPASVLLAVSGDAGVHAGNTLKAALAAHNGRGGGNATLAQGSLADAGALGLLVAQL